MRQSASLNELPPSIFNGYGRNVHDLKSQLTRMRHEHIVLPRTSSNSCPIDELRSQIDLNSFVRICFHRTWRKKERSDLVGHLLVERWRRRTYDVRLVRKRKRRTVVADVSEISVSRISPNIGRCPRNSCTASSTSIISSNKASTSRNQVQRTRRSSNRSIGGNEQR